MHRLGVGQREGFVYVVGAAVVGAVLLVGAVIAVNVSGNKKDGAGTQAAAATSASTSTTSSISSASAATSASRPPSALASSAAAAAAPSAPLVVASPGSQSAGAFYGAALYALAPDAQPQTVSTSLFASSSIAAKYWDSSKKQPKPAALCGTTAANLALVADDGGVVNVSLSANGQPTAQDAHVAVDPATGKITAITCAAAVAPTYVGGAQLVDYFGGLGYQQEGASAPSKTYAPKSADGPQPWINYDVTTCSQYGPQTWVLYAPVATTSGEAWQFSYDGSDQVQDVFLDPANGSIQRTLCEPFPAIPAADRRAAGRISADHPYDPAMSLIGQVLDAYLIERSQVSLGAMPTDEIAPYFVSPSAYSTAAAATGARPFLCGSKVPNGAWAGRPKVSGSSESFEVTLTDASGGPSDEGSPVAGKEKVVVDLDTMKIVSITCS